MGRRNRCWVVGPVLRTLANFFDGQMAGGQLGPFFTQKELTAAEVSNLYDLGAVALGLSPGDPPDGNGAGRLVQVVTSSAATTDDYDANGNMTTRGWGLRTIVDCLVEMGGESNDLVNTAFGLSWFLPPPGLVRCEIVDQQVASIIASMVMPEHWLDTALERISLRDEVARVRAEREQVHEKLKRLGRAFVDGLIDDADYERQKAQYEFDLTSLVVPEADSVAEAGRLVQQLPGLWSAANLAERRRLLLAVLDAVYVDVQEAGAPITIRPKAAFEAVLAATPALAPSIPN